MINSRTMQLVGTAVATDTISLDSDDLVSLVAERDVSVGDARDDNSVDTRADETLDIGGSTSSLTSSRYQDMYPR